MSLDVALGHQGASDALRALAGLHPSGTRLQLTAMRYAGLFAPRKQTMRMDRVAVVLRELSELMASGRVEWEGVSHAAPLEYWIGGMEAMLARRDLGKLDLPLDNHNYLRSVVAGAADRAAARAETARENQLAGRTPVGAPPPAPPETAAKREEPVRRRPPPEVFQSLNEAIGRLVQNPQNPSSENEA